MTFNKTYALANSPAGLMFIAGSLTIVAACLFPSMAPAILGAGAFGAAMLSIVGYSSEESRNKTRLEDTEGTAN